MRRNSSYTNGVSRRGYDYGSALYSLSGNGVLVYQKDGSSEARQYTWFDRTEKEVGHAGGTMRSLNSFSVSPDRKRLALQRPSDSGSGTDLWLADLARGNESRFTFDACISGAPITRARMSFCSNPSLAWQLKIGRTTANI